MFLEIIEPYFLIIKLYICELFLKIYAFSWHQWAMGWEPQTVLGGQKVLETD